VTSSAAQLFEPASLAARIAAADTQPGNNELMRFCFGTKPDSNSASRCIIHVPLPRLDDSNTCEIWESSEPVSSGVSGGVQFARTDSWLALHTTTPLMADDDLSIITEDIYTRLIKEALSQGYTDIVRTWNYVPDINLGSADTERYRQFTLGRAIAFDRLGFRDSKLPAGTGIGGDASIPLSITLLVTRKPCRRVENPRQISAYNYPKQYGPRSPSFSRAVLIGNTEKPLLLVSGTASIVGHETMHTGLAEQAGETCANIRTLQDVAAAHLQIDKRMQATGQGTYLRIYLRNDSDTDAALTALQGLIKEAEGYVVLQGDICRDDLLLEIEAVC